jgi:photosystem II stability/assembly factor-like uncharacterized protein
MFRSVTIVAVLGACLFVGCGDFLDNPTNTSSQLYMFEGGEILKSPYNFVAVPRDVYFNDSKTGFLVGNNGDIYKTADAGNNWQKKSSGTTLHLFSVMFINEQTGFVAGHAMKGCLDADCGKGSVLLKTTDGGETWSKTFFGDYVSIYNAHFFDAQRGLAIIHLADLPNQRDHHLSLTTDGGQSWQFIDLDISAQEVFHVVDNNVFIAGEQQRIFRSSDLGATWETIAVPMPVTAGVGKMYFHNKNFALVDGAELLYRTTNGGQSWEVVDPPFADIDLCYFYDDLKGYNMEAVFQYEGGDMPTFKGTTIYRTIDGGKTWLSLTSSDAMYIPMSSFPSLDLGYGSSYAEFYTIRKK